MNYPDLDNAVKHLLKTSKCMHCKSKYNPQDIHIIAATKLEGIFNMTCPSCHGSTIVTVFLSAETENEKKTISHQATGISQNDVLDIKNFLNNFNGDFKNIFSKE